MPVTVAPPGANSRPILANSRPIAGATECDDHGTSCQGEAMWAELEWSAILLGPVLAVSVGVGIWALSWLYDRVANAIRRWQDSWGR